MASKIVYLNGDYVPIEQAQVSVMDRGFLYGDGIYEVIPVFGGRLLRDTQHLRRLQNSLDRVGLANPYSSEEWRSLFFQLLEKNPGEDRSIYLQITRGAYTQRDLELRGAKCVPTVFIMVSQLKPVDIALAANGIAAITVQDFRWRACDIKSISLIANVMLRQQAIDAGVADAIMVRDGYVTEGTASNIFIVKHETIITPPHSEYLLPGITRDLILEIAQQNAMQCEQRDILETELRDADEIWLTSSTREIAPVIALNGNAVADGAAGPMWRKVVTLYQEYKQVLRAGQ